MGIHQEIYETRMRYSDPDKFKEMMKAKVAHQNGDDNVLVTDASIKGRGVSGGLEQHGVKHFSVDPKLLEAKERAKSYQTQTDYRDMYQSNLNS
jgi:hypothetical protein